MTHIIHHASRIALAFASLACVPSIQAGVSPQEAARLKSDLMPLGGERAANAAGTIPAWTGGSVAPAEKTGGRRGDPFKDEKPLFSVTPANMAQHDAHLTDGQKALLKKYPDYRIDVYRTHRTAAAPQAVYDNTAKNATRTSLVNDIPVNAFGGIPFPIPKSGAEVIWNHVLRWRGVAWTANSDSYQMNTDGKAVLVNSTIAHQQSPYYFENSSLEEFSKSGDYWTIRITSVAPPIRSGEALVGRRQLDGDKDLGWIYLTGQRRVRKLPNTCCDTPNPATAGVLTFDEVETFSGRLDRFEWTLVGKKEIYIPYNNNRMIQPQDPTEILGKGWIKPEYMRHELHRVWVVDAALKDGRRHPAPKGRYYCDEDTWLCTLGDRWDGNGQLWKTLWTSPISAPEVPGTIGLPFGATDLLSGQGYVGQLPNSKKEQLPMVKRYPDNTFTPDAMTADSLR